MPLAAMRLPGPPNALSPSSASAGRLSGLVGTVGQIAANPERRTLFRAACVQPRHSRAEDERRKEAVAGVVRRIEDRPAAGSTPQIDVTHEDRTGHARPGCGRSSLLHRASGYRVLELPSGAGHDGMAMIDVTDIAMLFVRCRGGISHHPAEHVTPETPPPARACCSIYRELPSRARRPSLPVLSTTSSHPSSTTAARVATVEVAFPGRR